MWIFGLSVYTIIQDGITDISDEGNQGSIRYAVWKNGWEAIKVSPILGLGTSGFPGVDDPFKGMEAHNTFIDFGHKYWIAWLNDIFTINFMDSVVGMAQK